VAYVALIFQFHVRAILRQGISRKIVSIAEAGRDSTGLQAAAAGVIGDIPVSMGSDAAPGAWNQ